MPTSREPEDLDRFGFRVDDLLEEMRERARVSLMFLDACRDDPFAEATPALVTKGIIAKRSGFAPVPDSKLGQALIAHAGEEGCTISDAGEGLSPFTAELVVQPVKDIEIHDVLREVREAVQMKTGTQTPWTNDALTDEVYLRRDPAAVKAKGAGATRRRATASSPGGSSTTWRRRTRRSRS